MSVQRQPKSLLENQPGNMPEAGTQHRSSGVAQPYRFETSNDNRLILAVRNFSPSRRQIMLASGFGIGAVLALMAMLNGSAFYQAESRIFVDVKQELLQAGGSTPTLDAETESRIVNEKLLELTSKPILTKVVDNLGLQKARLFETDNEPDVLTALAGWYRSFFQKEPVSSLDTLDGDASEQLERAITLSPEADSTNISIKVTTAKPRNSALIANQLAEVLKATENKPAPVATVSQADLDAMLIKVQKADRDITDFQTAAPVTETSSETSEIANELADLRSKIQNTQKTIDLLKKSGSNPATLNVISDDILGGKLLGLKGQLKDAQNKIVELSQNLGPKHPDLLAAQKLADGLAADVAKELPLLAKALDADVTKKKAAEALLVQELDSRKSAAADVVVAQSSAPTLDELQKQSESLHAQYASMLLNGPGRKMPDPVIRIISKATVPDSPMRSGFVTTLFAIIVGGLLGMLAAAIAMFGKSETGVSTWQPAVQQWDDAESETASEPLVEDDVDSYLAELSLAEAALEAREKELELQEILLLNSRLERLANLLDQAADPMPVSDMDFVENRHYPSASDDLYGRVFSQVANSGYSPRSSWQAEIQEPRELERVRSELRALRGRVIHYASNRR